MNFNQTHHTSIEYPASRPTRSIGIGVGGVLVGEAAETHPAAQVIAVITSQNFSDAEAVGIRV